MPSISTCMILKNEADTIYKTLESVSFSDEFIIGIDDKTTDDTYKEAMRFLRDRKHFLYYFKWEDDFSKARNYGIDQASGEYILIMDGHETLVSHRIDKMNFKHDVYLFEIEIQQGHHRTMFQQARLFRNSYRYHNKSHNILIYKAEDAAKILGTVVLHKRSKKLQDARSKQRKEMNIPDLTNRVKTGDKRAMAQIAQEYYSYQDWDKAIDAFKFYLGQEMMPSERYHTMMKLGMAYYYSNKFALAEKVWVESEGHNADKRNAHYIFLGSLAKRFENNEEALAWFDKALAIEKPQQFYFLFPDFYHEIPKRLKNDLSTRVVEG